MTTRHMPKTLAKVLHYVLYHAPWEYGLFWSPDGTMPWKELYWALQEDPTLRYVREAHLREIEYLGIPLPVLLDGSILRLRKDYPFPGHTVPDHVPDRLFFACRRKHFPVVLRHGLSATSRPWLPLVDNRDMAMRLGRRRDPEPILVEVFAQRALEAGTAFQMAGPGLYLVERVPLELLLFPLRKEEESIRSGHGKRDRKPDKPQAPMEPGSFLLAPGHLPGAPPEKEGSSGGWGGARKKGKREAEWKRAARNERHKREV